MITDYNKKYFLLKKDRIEKCVFTAVKADQNGQLAEATESD